MRIAVYSICKNEAQFVRRYLESVKDADLICIADTGSTDNTVQEFRIVAHELDILDKLKIQTIEVSPWRFDTPRTANLLMIPADFEICICLDLDEILVGKWRETIESQWYEGITRIRYTYVWNWQDEAETIPGVVYKGDKIHIRKGYRWDMPVHEMLTLDARVGPENHLFVGENDFQIHHHADNTKSRSQYLPLLELCVKENPYNDRQAHYYARELYFNGRNEEAVAEFKRHLALPSAKWGAERAASCRYMGNCLWALSRHDEAFDAFRQAIKEDPEAREGYVSLAQAHRAYQQWDKVKEYCELALSKTEVAKTYISDPVAWGDWPHTMLKEAVDKLL